MNIPPTAAANAAQEMANRMDFLSRRLNGEAPQARLHAAITERHEDLNQRIQNAGTAAIRLQNRAQEIVGNLLEDARELDLTAPERAQLERLHKELKELEKNHSSLTIQIKEGQKEISELNNTKSRLQERQKEFEARLNEKEASLRRPNRAASDILTFGNEIIRRAPSAFTIKV